MLRAELCLFTNERARRVRPGRWCSRPNGVEGWQCLGRVGRLHCVCSTMNTGDLMGGLARGNAPTRVRVGGGAATDRCAILWLKTERSRTRGPAHRVALNEAPD